MRPTTQNYFMQMARLVATRSTCLRRSVGCVLVDHKNRVLATGYNGVPSGWPHCNANETHACPGARAPSGTMLDACAAVHAEQNAILQCVNVDMIFAAYVTTFPCVSCAKLLLNTPCNIIYYGEEYAQSAGMTMWVTANRQLLHVGSSPQPNS